LDNTERLDVSFEIQVPFPKQSSSNVNNTVAEVTSSLMETINNSVSKLEVDGQVLTLDRSSPQTLKFIGVTCASGQVLKGALCGMKCSDQCTFMFFIKYINVYFGEYETPVYLS
jgi:hypothetical protein